MKMTFTMLKISLFICIISLLCVLRVHTVHFIRIVKSLCRLSFRLSYLRFLFYLVFNLETRGPCGMLRKRIIRICIQTITEGMMTVRHSRATLKSRSASN